MKVILVFIVVMTGYGSQEREYPMPSMEICLKSVEAAAVRISHGDENEQSAVLFCAYRK